jgi:hypothetical protein
MKKMFGILFALVLVVSLGLVTAAPVLAGTTIHVPGDYATIQEAIDAAAPGDTIMVAAGEYDAFVLEGKSNISIIGAQGATVTTANLIKALPVVGNAWVLAAVYDSEDVNIEGINFDGTGVSGKPVVVGIAYVDSTGRIADLTVKDVIATEKGVGVAIIGYVATSTVEIAGTTISNNGAVGEGAGIYVCGGSTLEAHFNSIMSNSACGLSNDGGGMVDATYNWWGDASGPLHQTNFLGKGNAVIGTVTFKPWLGSAPAIVKTETVTNGTVDALVEADTEVAVKGTATVTISKLVVEGTATVAIAKYASSLYLTTSDDFVGYAAPTSLDFVALSDEFKQLDIFSDVCVKNYTHGTWVEIGLYYTDAQAKYLEEESLRPFWWDGTQWAACSNAGVNTTNITIDNQDYSGYMWAEIRETGTTPTLSQLTGTPWGGYGHPSVPSGACGCFIATAAYGTDTAREIDILREFRDEVLLPNISGARLVSFYYRTSPPIADFISQHEVLRTAVRVGFIDPIVTILNWSHDSWSARYSQ